jgi:hypothetical protein
MQVPEASAARCACAQESVVQSVPLNDAGTGIAQAGHTNFQPLGTSVGAISTPAQNTQATLASLGQGGHAPAQQRGQQRAQQQAAQLEGGQQSQGSSSYAGCATALDAAWSLAHVYEPGEVALHGSSFGEGDAASRLWDRTYIQQHARQPVMLEGLGTS